MKQITIAHHAFKATRMPITTDIDEQVGVRSVVNKSGKKAVLRTLYGIIT